jgi:hypothetical protein
MNPASSLNKSNKKANVAQDFYFILFHSTTQASIPHFKSFFKTVISTVGWVILITHAALVQ